MTVPVKKADTDRVRLFSLLSSLWPREAYFFERFSRQAGTHCDWHQPLLLATSQRLTQ